MNEILQYNDDSANKLLGMYLTPDIRNQRREFLEFIRIGSHHRILDVGSGSGFLTSDLGNGIGQSGWVCGIDISGQMLDLSKAHCADQSNVRLSKGEATRLPFVGNSFDIVVSMQVLEYIHDVHTVLAEINRVMRSGGQVVIMDTDWDSLVWYSAHPERANLIQAEGSNHVANPYLPRTMMAQMRDAGFQVEYPHIIPIFNPVFDANSFSNKLIDLIVTYVITRGKINPNEVEAWAQELRSLGETGQYFFSLNRYVFSAIKQ